MSDFLTRLTERLRPRERPLRPVVPSRFEPVTTVTATEPFRREPIRPLTVVDAQAEGNPVAARPDLHDHTAHVSPSADSEQAMQRQHQDSTTAVVTQTAQRTLEAAEAFVHSEQPLVRRQVGEALLPAQKISPAASTLPRGSTSFPLGKMRVKPTKQETVERSTVTQPSIEQQQSVQLRADRHSMRPADQNLLANDPFKPDWALSAAEPQTPAEEHESVHVERHVKSQLLPEPRETFPWSRLPFSTPKQGALLPAAGKSTYQSMDGNPGAEFDSKLFASPGIRVTIGRIEVRAIATPPPSPRPPAPRAPRSSLDDYLRSRKEAPA